MRHLLEFTLYCSCKDRHVPGPPIPPTTSGSTYGTLLHILYSLCRTFWKLSFDCKQENLILNPAFYFSDKERDKSPVRKIVFWNIMIMEYNQLEKAPSCLDSLKVIESDIQHANMLWVLFHSLLFFFIFFLSLSLCTFTFWKTGLLNFEIP